MPPLGRENVEGAPVTSQLLPPRILPVAMALILSATSLPAAHAQPIRNAGGLCGVARC